MNHPFAVAMVFSAMHVNTMVGGNFFLSSEDIVYPDQEHTAYRNYIQLSYHLHNTTVKGSMLHDD